ncbi:unnamed protein product [Adineta steineri]|uniref:Mannosyltransferase n=1 Tax=Adineta steineri TaxID=433720 RepID=A0A813YB25_9BILA|nr:unnamed protein product [Adineta steineri]CAF0887506.1 unnamed protein product [Adineta steineri]
MKSTTVAQQSGDTNATQKVKRSICVPSFLTKYTYQSEFIWYFIGVIIRIIWTLVYPQQGYIHPDEFFQGPEVVFDDIFLTNLTRTHEFNPAAPLRSVAILYLLYGLPVSILSWLSSLLHWSSVPFHLKLIFPRATILSLSLCSDILFYRLIKNFYPNFKSKQYGIIMNYYGIAHVLVVFFTRTLSNSFEAFLFLTLIYLITVNVSSLLTIIINTSDHKTIVLNRHLILTSSLIGCVCSLGIFNRPTFPAFAIVPLIYWFTNIIPTMNHSFRFQLLLSRIISFIIGAFILTSSLIISFDSYYYNNGLSFIVDLKNRLIICPLNFILYNIDSTNLDKHGLHPPWLHFIVNATILYGPLHICTVLWCLINISSIKQNGQWIINRIFNRRSIIEIEQSTSPLLLYLYLVPFIPLSTFPHQEPRFLLPLLFPLILFIVPLLITHNLHQYIFRLWMIFNISIAIIFGHLHQGGLLPALQYFHNSPLLTSNKNFLVTYHTYMPPGYLTIPMSKFEYEQKFETAIIDLKGAKREEFDLTIENIFNKNLLNNLQVFVILPSTFQTDLIYLKQQKYSFHLLKQFRPHLDFDHAFEEPFLVNYAGTKYQWLQAIWNKYKLNLYHVTRG